MVGDPGAALAEDVTHTHTTEACRQGHPTILLQRYVKFSERTNSEHGAQRERTEFEDAWERIRIVNIFRMGYPAKSLPQGSIFVKSSLT